MRGFLLNYESQHNFEGGFDRMIFHGVREDGMRFRWVETKPYLIGFVPKQKEIYSKLLGAEEIYRTTTGFHDFRGVPHYAVFFRSLEGLKRIRSLYVDRGASWGSPRQATGEVEKSPFVAKTADEVDDEKTEAIVESSIIPTTQFLAARGICGGLKFLQSESSVEDSVAVYVDPEVESETYLPKLRVLSFDIEIGVEEDLLYSISLVCADYEKVLMLCDSPSDELPHKTEFFSTEKELLMRFCQEVAAIDPHIITGWFLIGFDFKYLAYKAEENGMQLILGVGNTPVETFQKKSGEFSIFIPGRTIIDGIDATGLILTRKPENMKLDTVAHFLLGIGKTIDTLGAEKVNEITRMFYEDKKKLSEYNLIDSKLVNEILTTLKAIPYYQLRVSLSSLPMQRLASASEIFQNTYICELHRRNLIGFSEKMHEINMSPPKLTTEIEGGIYKNVAAFVMEDLYIACALHYRLDPMGMAMATANEAEAEHNENGYLIHIRVNVLGDLLRRLLQAKSQHHESSVERKAIAGHMQDLLRGLLIKENRFSLPHLRSALKEGGFAIAKNLAAKLDAGNRKVLFYDDKHIYVEFGDRVLNEEGWKREIKQLELEAKQFVGALFGEPTDLQLATAEKIFPHFFLPEQQYDSVRNNYLRYSAIDDKQHFNSRSLSRGALKLKRYFEEKLLQAIFDDSDVQTFLRNFRRELFAGEYDRKLIYKRRLTRLIDDYSLENNSPFVQAAQKMRDEIKQWETQGKRKNLMYCLTKNGGEPVANLEVLKKLEIDYDAYLQKEIVPLAKKILQVVQYDKYLYVLTGQEKQLDLF